MNLTGQRPFVKAMRPEKSTRIRNASAGKDCTLQIPGICRHDPAYTVGAHIRLFGFAGMGDKPDDLFIIDACDRCHSALDNRAGWADAPIGFEDILRALMTTQKRRRAEGLIQIVGIK